MARMGSAIVVLSDTPVFEKATRSSKPVLVLQAGQGVEVFQIPVGAGADGTLWAQVSSSEGVNGFVDVGRLSDFVGESDVAQHRMLRLQLHPVDAEPSVLERDIVLLQEFTRRFPASPLSSQVKLSLADRHLAIAREAADTSNPNGSDYSLALERSQLAADAYDEVVRTGRANDRLSAERGREEAEQILSSSDAKLNPAPTARLLADRSTAVRVSR